MSDLVAGRTCAVLVKELHRAYLSAGKPWTVQS
jgi:hypothetical protein